ncbi:MAG TPA: anhydro-N-acetylmuramic acid kinase [Candidatus Ozemobacteraceae bacterium]|mgnify:CR=1 FL=1|nr:anhydro-N-acetylmuramic acid kinase [Candidatus Ozemobacteraceae bacterium]
MIAIPWPSDADLRILGLMSGTSGDGIDGALVTFSTDGGFRLEWHEAEPFPPAVRNRLQRLMREGTPDDVALAATWVAELYARAVDAFRGRHPESRIDALAAHGQTLAHVPAPRDWDGIPVRGTLQALNAQLLAERARLPVVYDFRSRDLAAGGQGAPLVPLGDLRFFGHLAVDETIVVLNVGGIANVTVIRPGPAGPHVSAAFDTGPGNMLMDALARELSGGAETYDRDGHIAVTGRSDQAVVSDLLSDPYFHVAPPKSTGRDRFGEDRLHAILAGTQGTVSGPDMMSSLLDVTVVSIAEAVRIHVNPGGKARRVVIAGGGALNGELCRRLALLLPEGCLLERSDAHGVPVSAREAMGFAALGEAFLRGRPGNIPAATGATGPMTLGAIVPA